MVIYTISSDIHLIFIQRLSINCLVSSIIAIAMLLLSTVCAIYYKKLRTKQ